MFEHAADPLAESRGPIRRRRAAAGDRTTRPRVKPALRRTTRPRVRPALRRTARPRVRPARQDGLRPGLGARTRGDVCGSGQRRMGRPAKGVGGRAQFRSGHQNPLALGTVVARARHPWSAARMFEHAADPLAESRGRIRRRRAAAGDRTTRPRVKPALRRTAGAGRVPGSGERRGGRLSSGRVSSAPQEENCGGQ
jgi:hypothetical protein